MIKLVLIVVIFFQMYCNTQSVIDFSKQKSTKKFRIPLCKAFCTNCFISLCLSFLLQISLAPLLTQSCYVAKKQPADYYNVNNFTKQCQSSIEIWHLII